jgi:regulator of ribonuclease activity A
MNGDNVNATFSTAGLVDHYPDVVISIPLQFRQFGAVHTFSGRAVTVHSPGDNALLKQVVAQPGAGRVIVVDAEGSLDHCMLGDNMAAEAAGNGWAGMIVVGAVRDTNALRDMSLGIKALGTNPARPTKVGSGSVDVPITVSAVEIMPGHMIWADDDGILVAPNDPGSDPEVGR